jgi:hypothetical protein
MEGESEGGMGFPELAGAGGSRCIPGLRDDDVVEGLAFLAEAGEANLDDHTGCFSDRICLLFYLTCSLRSEMVTVGDQCTALFFSFLQLIF